MFCMEPVLHGTICWFSSTCTVYFIVSVALQVSFVLEMLIGVRLGGYTDFWIAGVELGDIYKLHTMGPASSLLPLSRIDTFWHNLPLFTTRFLPYSHDLSSTRHKKPQRRHIGAHILIKITNKNSICLSLWSLALRLLWLSSVLSCEYGDNH